MAHQLEHRAFGAAGGDHDDVGSRRVELAHHRLAAVIAEFGEHGCGDAFDRHAVVER